MATSSFTKDFVLDAKASKKFKDRQTQPGIRVPVSAVDRIQEGKTALAQFSLPSKK